MELSAPRFELSGIKGTAIISAYPRTAQIQSTPFQILSVYTPRQQRQPGCLCQKAQAHESNRYRDQAHVNGKSTHGMHNCCAHRSVAIIVAACTQSHSQWPEGGEQAAHDSGQDEPVHGGCRVRRSTERQGEAIWPIV
eukprot:1161659-Pelagomonas_calceolata.AAC.9